MSGGAGEGGMATRMTASQRGELVHRMREPIATFVALLALLAVNALTGWFQLFPHVWVLNLGVLLAMIATVLLFSMEVIKDPPLVRLFSVLGFCWVAILFTMTLVDYTTR